MLLAHCRGISATLEAGHGACTSEDQLMDEFEPMRAKPQAPQGRALLEDGLARLGKHLVAERLNHSSECGPSDPGRRVE